MEKEEQQEVIEFVKFLKEQGLEKYLDRFVYMPIVPMAGIEKEFMIEEFYGMKIARLISPPED